MSRLRKLVTVVIGLLIVAGIVAGVYWLAIHIWAEFAALPKEIAVGIVAGVFTILGSTLTVVAGRYF